MNKRFIDGLWVGSIVTILVTLTAVTCVQNSSALNLKNWNRVNLATELIEKKYYGDYSNDDIMDGIMAGTCFNLDSYSAYLTTEDYEDAIDPNQYFGGVGIFSTFDKYTKVYKIVYCYDDTPASRAGLKRNDIIEAVDGYDVYGMELDQISRLLRGKPGTTVSLKVNRNGELLDFDLVRELIKAPHAYSYRLPNDIGFIKITSFTGDVVVDFKKALDKVADSKGIIIDLRGNSGGTTDCFKAIMEQLLPSCIIQTVVYKDGKREPLECESVIKEQKYKFVILCDSGTASCAESMTQAMKELAGAKVVGIQTYGKGVVQEYFKVDSKSVLRLTTGYIESPNGVVWNEVGIEPDVVVEYDYLGEDFEESVLLFDSQVLAGYNELVELLK